MEESNINVICLESQAFYKLIDKVTEYITEKHQVKEEKWLHTDEAMTLLGIKSKSTLQALRNDGKIRFTQPQKKIILYDRNSIMEYLDKNAQETF